MWRLAWVLAAIVLVATPAKAAQVHALVVGINDYAAHTDLAGAVNDVDDVTDALRRRISGKLVTLKDSQATRAGFMDGWNSILSGAARDDVIILVYSGHGSQITDDAAFKDEEDGLDERLILHGFSHKLVGTDKQDHILDDELLKMFETAGEKGVRVIFVADSCHSGGLARGGGSAALAGSGLPYRYTPAPPGDDEPAFVPSDFAQKPEVTPNVTFISAGLAHKRVQEVLIHGKPRGALSYAFARAIEGAADTDGNGTISIAEFHDYMVSVVEEYSNGRQTPVFSSLDPDFALLTRPGKVNVEKDDTIRLHVKNSNASLAAVDGATLVDAVAKSDLVWDAGEKALYNAQSDKLASGIDADRLSSVVKIELLRRQLRAAMAKGKVEPLKIEPDNGLHCGGCRVDFRIDTIGGPYLTIFNLSAKGQVQFLYPYARGKIEDRMQTVGSGWTEGFCVRRPFGADYLVSMISDRPLKDFHFQLKVLHENNTLGGMEKFLAKALEEPSLKIGIKATFTSNDVKACEARQKTCDPQNRCL